jgi:hypothetical protein
MPSILDPSFKYTPSARTDIRKTFRKEQARIAAEKAAVPTPRELLGADDLHPRLTSWLEAHAADEKADLLRAARYIDTDTRR